MLRQIRRASVLGEAPTDAQIVGGVRRQQVLYAVKFYKPGSKHIEGFSAPKAAEKAINHPSFKGVEGAYSSNQKAALVKAILREYHKPANCT